jgi:hypothetical protein
MLIDTENLPDDPVLLKAMIATLQAENAKISATLRAHDQLVQALRLRIAKLQKQAFGASSEKIEREIPSRDIAARYPAGRWNSLNWRWKTCWLRSPRRKTHRLMKMRLTHNLLLHPSRLRTNPAVARVSRTRPRVSAASLIPVPRAPIAG